MSGANRVVIGLPARYENAKKTVGLLEDRLHTAILEGLQFGIDAQKAWSQVPLTEERIQDMAGFILTNPGATYDAYVEHSIRDIVVNADD